VCMRVCAAHAGAGGGGGCVDARCRTHRNAP
jgi:hypothetical protein